MSFALSVFVWHTVQSNLGVLDVTRVIMVVCAIGVFLSLFVLGSFICTVKEMAVTAAAFPLGFLLVTGKGWIAAILAFLFLVYAAGSMRHQIHNRIKISFYPLISYGTPAAVTALAVLFVYMGYSYPFRITGSFTIPERVMSPLVPFAESFIRSQAPGYEKGMTVDAFLSASAGELLEQKYGAGALANKQVQAALADAVEKQRSELAKQLRVPLKGDERVEDILASLTNTYLNSYLVSYREFVPLVVAVSVFLAVKSVGFFVGRIAVLVAWLASHALIALNVIEKKKESVEREVLSA